jgi:hypothetical protein
VNKLNPRSTRGKFSAGTSGNPSRRPLGSRNKATLLVEQMIEGEAEQLTRKVLELALGGDLTALRLCMERLVPPRKDRPIHLDLPPIDTVAQIPAAMTSVAMAIGEGRITPNEGEVLANLLVIQKNVIVTATLEQRIGRIEVCSGTTEQSGNHRATDEKKGGRRMTNLEFRIARLEIRLRALAPAPPRGFQESWEFEWATDPEGFRRRAMEPDRFQGTMQGVMESPIPMKILRFIAFERLLEEAQQKKQFAKTERLSGPVPTTIREVKHPQPAGGFPPVADSQERDLPCPRKGTAEPNRRRTPHAPMEEGEPSNVKTVQKSTRTRHAVAVVADAKPVDRSGARKERS